MISECLRKNELNYWLCPLCDHALIPSKSLSNLEEELYCPKMVDVHSGTRWVHFGIQKALNGPQRGQLSYVAVIPPFYVSWYKESGTLFVKRFGTHREDWRMFDILDCKLDYPEKDLLKLYARLANLRVFA
jgi:hypothetical protein